MQKDPKKYCRFLRAKNAYGTLEGGGQPFLTIDTGTTQYWCVTTSAPYGPDSGIVHLSKCWNEKRTCYQKPIPEEEE